MAVASNEVWTQTGDALGNLKKRKQDARRGPRDPKEGQRWRGWKGPGRGKKRQEGQGGGGIDSYQKKSIPPLPTGRTKGRPEEGHVEPIQPDRYSGLLRPAPGRGMGGTVG